MSMRIPHGRTFRYCDKGGVFFPSLAHHSKREPLHQVLLDENPENNHRDRDDRSNGGLRAVKTSLDSALILVEQDRQCHHFMLGEGQREQELAPVQDEDKKEGDHQSGGHKRQNDTPERVHAPGTHHACRMLQRIRDLFNEAQHHPYDEGKCCRHIEHPQARIGVKHIEPCAQ